MAAEVDDVAFMGSPGLGDDRSGAPVDSIDDLGMSPGHVFVGMASNDPIGADFDVHGNNPAVADQFSGAIRYQAETDAAGAPSQYFDGRLDDRGQWVANESLHNLGNIATGQGVAPDDRAALATDDSCLGACPGRSGNGPATDLEGRGLIGR